MGNEFVMVPRSELVRLQENMDPLRGAVAWGIVYDLLVQPAAQHLGNSKLVDNIHALLALDARGALAPSGIGGLARELLESSAAALSAQHQGEPVAWADPKDLVEDGYGHSFGVSSSEYSGRVPLYTHADPAEVERLRERIELLEVQAENDTEANTAIRAERDYYRAQLAERNALLQLARKLMDQSLAALNPRAKLSISIREFIASASTELSGCSTPPEPFLRCSFCDTTDNDGNPWSGSSSSVDGHLVYRVTACKDHKHLADAVHEAMNPSAPVERDERAEFKREARYFVIKLKDLELLSPIDSDLVQSLMGLISATMESWGAPSRQCVVVESDWPEFEPTWAAIEARAALERKP